MSETNKNASDPKLLILVCAYNEGENLPTLLNALQEVAPQASVLLVDDGSTDQTHPWLAANAGRFPNLVVKNRGAKLGLGTAIRDGLQFAIDGNFDLCVNLDADLSHDPKVIPQLMTAMRPGVDLVIGSRYVVGGRLVNCSWRRKIVSRAVNYLARLIIGWKVRDCSSAYRCYRIKTVEELHIASIDNASYGFLEEVLWLIWKHGGGIVEVPIHYVERELGESKISLHEARQTFQTLVRLHRFRR